MSLPSHTYACAPDLIPNETARMDAQLEVQADFIMGFAAGAEVAPTLAWAAWLRRAEIQFRHAGCGSASAFRDREEAGGAERGWIHGREFIGKNPSEPSGFDKSAHDRYPKGRWT